MTSAASLRRQVEEADEIRAARIPLGRLRFHPGNARRDLGDLRALAQSLREDGCHQPIEVFRSGRDYIVQDGNRRLGAAQLAGLRTLPAVIVPQRHPRDQLVAMLSTDVHKLHLAPAERAAAVERLVVEIGSVREVAARLGVAEATVYRWRSGAGQREVLVDGDAPARPAELGAAGSPLAVRRDGRPAMAAASVQRVSRARSVVSARRLAELVEAWAGRSAAGLDAVQAGLLLDELRRMVAPADVAGAA